MSGANAPKGKPNVKLDQYSQEELVALEDKYFKCGKFKTCDVIRREITDRIAAKLKAEGKLHWSAGAGYTGLQTNRR